LNGQIFRLPPKESFIEDLIVRNLTNDVIEWLMGYQNLVLSFGNRIYQYIERWWRYRELGFNLMVFNGFKGITNGTGRYIFK